MYIPINDRLIGGRTIAGWRHIAANKDYELNGAEMHAILKDWLAMQEDPYVDAFIHTFFLCAAIGIVTVTALGLYFAYQLIQYN